MHFSSFSPLQKALTVFVTSQPCGKNPSILVPVNGLFPFFLQDFEDCLGDFCLGLQAVSPSLCNSPLTLQFSAFHIGFASSVVSSACPWLSNLSPLGLFSPRLEFRAVRPFWRLFSKVDVSLCGIRFLIPFADVFLLPNGFSMVFVNERFLSFSF